VTLSEEEISDVTLATFYVFDKENAGAPRPGSQLARSHSRGRGSAVRRGCTGCAVACGGGGLRKLRNQSFAVALAIPNLVLIEANIPGRFSL
jgi:hypothetical protein